MEEIHEWLKSKISELDKHINENTWDRSTINDRNFLCKIESKIKNLCERSEPPHPLLSDVCGFIKDKHGDYIPSCIDIKDKYRHLNEVCYLSLCYLSYCPYCGKRFEIIDEDDE